MKPPRLRRTRSLPDLRLGEPAPPRPESVIRRSKVAKQPRLPARDDLGVSPDNRHYGLLLLARHRVDGTTPFVVDPRSKEACARGIAENYFCGVLRLSDGTIFLCPLAPSLGGPEYPAKLEGDAQSEEGARFAGTYVTAGVQARRIVHVPPAKRSGPHDKASHEQLVDLVLSADPSRGDPNDFVGFTVTKNDNGSATVHSFTSRSQNGQRFGATFTARDLHEFQAQPNPAVAPSSAPTSTSTASNAPEPPPPPPENPMAPFLGGKNGTMHFAFTNMPSNPQAGLRKTDLPWSPSWFAKHAGAAPSSAPSSSASADQPKGTNDGGKMSYDFAMAILLTIETVFPPGSPENQEAPGRLGSMARSSGASSKAGAPSSSPP